MNIQTIIEIAHSYERTSAGVAKNPHKLTLVHVIASFCQLLQLGGVHKLC